MPEFKTQHYWRIHRRVTQRAMRSLSKEEWATIAADSGHETREFRRFEAYVNSETLRLYEDPEFPYNAPETFKVSYYE